MNKKTSRKLNSNRRSMYIGLLSMLAIVILGAGLAFATGMTQPQLTHADDGDDIGDVGSGDLGGGDFGVGDLGIDSPGLQTGDDINDSAPTDLGNGYTPSSSDSNVTDSAPTDLGIGINDGTTDVGNAPDTSTTEAPTDSDTNLSPCCTNDYDTDVGDAPDTSTTEAPVDTDTNLSPCCTEDTTPEDTTPVDVTPIDTTPVVVTTPPPVIVTPPPTPVCNSGFSGTYPNCVPIVTPPPIIVTPPVTPVCATGDTGTYPDCVPPPVIVVPPPTTPECANGDTGTYPNCVPPVVVTGCVSDCQTGGGGGGGTSGQIITTVSGGGGGTSGQILPQAPVAPIVSSVYLSQIPYTGLDLGPVGTVVYWVLLVLICAAAAYLILFQLLPWIIKGVQSFGKEVGHSLNQPAAVGLALAGAHAQGGDSHAAPAPQTQVIHATTTVSKPNPSAYSAAQGFSSFAQGGSLTIDDIVNGLARLPEVENKQPTSVTPSAPVEYTTTAHTEAVITPAPVQMPAPQAAQQPARAEQPAAAVSTDVRDFCAALLQGNRDVVFGTLRQVVREGGDAEMFITQVVCAFDDAYRNRVEGTKVNGEIAQLTQNCATPFLERLMNALTNAVDSSYSPGISGSKLALTRALAVVEG